MEKKRSWACTFVLQVSLFIAFYLPLNLDQPQTSIYNSRKGTRTPLDVYFLSVRGGYRPLKQRALLLKQMEKVANMYKARFVVNISELGEDDPLTQNVATILHVSFAGKQALPTTENPMVFYESIKRQGRWKLPGADQHNLRENINSCWFGYRADFMGPTSGFKNGQLNWLTETLEATTNSWIIVSGYHPVVICDKERVEAKQVYGALHNIFMKYGVNAYISRQGCNCHTVQDGVAYIGIADSIENEPLNSSNGRLALRNFHRDTVNDWFLLHRVGSLEITTYFVSSAGKIVNKAVIKQRGKVAM
ncbi:tartrate-resistant acid phosphatase type 5-like [Populus alba x Populus x berolinensis]|uniref:Tartrate-resistant acid phosphatase type 5-like n=1 Tax=Populus alba x Populus x berolinensis TaxID=444605 RepID=A0AAD6W0I7_9ROSI|nr:tartrate-resistant acid phosphatase type 5-like [Populus alba x Populus x berolinensis]